ncbi:MAG: right-handed parallel beta-helix repeat-containing protein, partial [Planctomycetes bacterium]|nr:right-handed parallel beta-helix repeat-containing protein [Planctomycetota bacterium]
DCTLDADCGDGRFCNGVETCNNGTCLSGTQPCSLGESCDEVGNVCTATVLEGFGTNTPGGAGGETYHVTSLADSGAGTFRDGVSNRDYSVDGPRTIVFDVAGTITLLGDLKVREPFLTIDGSTAPSPGITIRKTTITEGEFIIGGTHDIIIRHVRFWGLWQDGGPTSNNAVTIGIDGDSGPDYIAKNIVLDHVTVRNATDSGPDIWGEVSDLTFSWCFFFYNRHPTTMSHYPAPYQTRRNISMHHNVYAENGERNPQIRGDTHDLDFVNNVIFNWGNYGGTYGVKLRDREEVWPSRINIVNNFFSSQNNPSNGLSCQCQNSCTSIPDVYVGGNVVENPDLSGCTLLSSPVAFPASARVTTYAVEDLGTLMLPGVGMLYRDTEEQTIMNRILVAMGGALACVANADCDDGQFCNGSEACVNNACVAGSSPCAVDETCDDNTNACVATEPPCSVDADCADSRYCNGVELCVAGACVAGTNPCPAGQRCIETTDTCEDLAAGAWTPPIGIPEPSFGIHETVENVYGDPNYYTYFVDNAVSCSDDNNGGFGSPAQPRCSIPSDFSAGQVVQIRAGTYSATVWTAHGTANQPVFIRGMDPQNKPRIFDSKLHLIGEYFIVENLDFDVTKIRDGGITNMSYVSFRFNELHDKGGNGFEGSLHNVVVYGNHIHHIGDQVVPDDKHGVTMNPGSSYVWIVDNEINHTSGDGVQFCHGCDASVAPRFIYIGRNVIHDCVENAVDFKTAADVIVSQNVMYGFRDVDTSDGSAVLIGSNGISDPARNIWVIFNEIFDSVNAIRVEASPTAVSILGNVMYDLGGSAVVFEKEAPDVYIVNNTVYNADLVINQDWRENFRVHIYNNIFAQIRGQRFGNHLNMEGDNVADNSELDDNLFWQGSGQPIVIQWGSPLHTIDSTLEFAAFPGGGNNRLSDPLFMDVGAANFELRSGSPAIDAGNSAIVSPAYGRFTELYGLDIRVDINGNPRPQATAWDLGAIESP